MLNCKNAGAKVQKISYCRLLIMIFFILLCRFLRVFMKYLGYSLVLLGCLGLILLYLMHLAFVNSLLIASLLIIITGVVVQVWKEKRESNY